MLAKHSPMPLIVRCQIVSGLKQLFHTQASTEKLLGQTVAFRFLSSAGILIIRFVATYKFYCSLWCVFQIFLPICSNIFLIIYNCFFYCILTNGKYHKVKKYWSHFEIKPYLAMEIKQSWISSLNLTNKFFLTTKIICLYS